MLKVSVLDTSSGEKSSLFYKLQWTCDDQCRREEERGPGSRYKLPGPGVPEGGPGPDYVAYDFVPLGSIIIGPMHKLTLSKQAQVTQLMTVFPISCKDFQPVRPWWGAINMFTGARTRSPRPWRWQAYTWLRFKKSDNILNLIQHMSYKKMPVLIKLHALFNIARKNSTTTLEIKL